VNIFSRAHGSRFPSVDAELSALIDMQAHTDNRHLANFTSIPTEQQFPFLCISALHFKMAILSHVVS